jgi:sigma-54 dependent transcriptional regulator
VGDGSSLTVLIHDQRTERRAEVQKLIEAAGATARAVTSAVASVNRLDPLGNGDPAMALLAVDGDGQQPSEAALDAVLPLIRALNQRSVPTVAYGHKVEAWPLGQRCRILLAGAPVLLDSAGAGLEGQVRTQLRQRLDAQRDARRTDWRISTIGEQLGIVGRSRVLREALAAVERSAGLSDMPVLLLGETGTGKELLARAVHLLDSRRREFPFVALNCAALTKTLAEAELFGHRKGAFSGADRDRQGLIRAAHGGVLFLDEIGELDLELQAKLLRVLQERRVRCLGDTCETPVDVRIVVATHRDLRQMVKDQCFRADLLSRLWVYPIQLAPLRRRREDIPALVQHFVGKHAPVLAVTVEAAFTQALQQTRLEGNIRQLENIVQRALANMDATRSLGLAQLPPEIWDELAAPDDGPPGPAVAASLDQDLNLSRALICHERALVLAAMRRSGGNQTQAARLLGITARTMYTKLRKHNLESGDASS